MVNTQFFINYIGQFSYLGILVIGALVGYLIPLPEEIFLLVVGYIAGTGAYNVYAATIFAIMGVLIGDNVLFFLSKYKASKIISKLIKRLNKHEIMEHRHVMKKHIGKTIFTLKFIVGLRIFGPFLAGSMKVKWKVFQLYNFLAVAVYIPILVFLGYHFHNKIALVITSVEIVRHLIFVLALMVLGFLISVFIKKKYGAKDVY